MSRKERRDIGGCRRHSSFITSCPISLYINSCPLLFFPLVTLPLSLIYFTLLQNILLYFSTFRVRSAGTERLRREEQKSDQRAGTYVPTYFSPILHLILSLPPCHPLPISPYSPSCSTSRTIPSLIIPQTITYIRHHCTAYTIH